MDRHESLEKAARELVAGSPSLSEQSYQALLSQLRVLAAHRRAQEPDAVARRENLGDLRAEMRLTCERYLGSEITLLTMYRRLRFLEQEERNHSD